LEAAAHNATSALMTRYRPDPQILALGPNFFDAVEPARFPQCTPRFLNRRWADRVGLDLDEEQWAAHFCRFAPLPVTGLRLRLNPIR